MVAGTRTLADLGQVLRNIMALLASDPRQANAQARAAVRDYPEQMMVHRVLAATLRAQGNVAEAERAELKAIEIGLASPAVAAAEKALAEDRLEEAEQRIRPYLRENPEDAGAAVILGTIAERCNAHREAENLFRRGFLLAPAYNEARVSLAKLFNGTGRYDEALAVLDEALERDPRHPAALSLKASILVQERRLEPAITVFRRMLRAHPNDGINWINFAYLLKTTGQLDEAVTAYRRAIDLEPHRGNAWFGMANLKTVRFDAKDIERMKIGLEHPDISDDDRIHLHFSLGRALDDHGDYAGAFAQYSAGSVLRRAKAPHDSERVHGNVRKAIEVFTPEFFAGRADAGCPAPDPIFVVSMPRSGSTLVEQILASHPAIEGTEELFDMERIALEFAPDGPAGGYLEKIADIGPEQLRERGEHYMAATRRHRKTDRPLFTDKMPSNWVYTGLIHTLLPKAKIIDIRRDPMGCGFANFSQHYNWGINFSYDLNDIGRFYSDYVRLMAHFDRVAPGLVHRVFYEDLVEDPEREIRRMLDYLELPFDPACLDFHRNTRAVHTPSSQQVRRPINRDGLDTWRRYEPWLGPLKEALGPVLEAYPKTPDRWPD